MEREWVEGIFAALAIVCLGGLAIWSWFSYRNYHGRSSYHGHVWDGQHDDDLGI